MVLVAIAAIAFAIPRAARPELYGGEAFLPGLASDLADLFLRGELGQACSVPGCPDVRTLLGRGAMPDVYLLVGGTVIGVIGGLLGGIVCANRPRSRTSRVA